jgi:peptidyl-prolyl cis-trans isomerase SurA
MFGGRCFCKAWLWALLGCAVVTPLAAQTQINNLGSARANANAPQRATAATSNQEADTIVAVVNKDVITRRELDIRTQQIKTDLTRQRAQIPPDEILQSQLLQRLIIERLQVQEAKRLNLEVTDQVLKTALEGIAQRNKMTAAQLRSHIEGAGVVWADYGEMIKREVLVDRLRQRVVDSTILISDAEVDAFLREQKARQTGGLLSSAPVQVVAPPPPPPPKPKAAPIQPAVMGLAQILVRVPEDSTDDEVKVLSAKAQALLARLRKGESFEALAKASSEGPEASRGGDMGGRLVSDWPELFLKAVAGVGDGQISNVIKSGNGFHILKVLGRAGGAPPPEPVAQQAPTPPAPGAGVPAPQGPMLVEQMRARHILIKTTAVMTSELAKQKLDQVRERIVNGNESFSDLAKRFSNDTSAPQGGNLGWLNPGETVPPFEQAMKKLKIGEVSEPVQTSFGWHLIVVDERRTQDMAEQFQRNQVRQRLFAQRSEASFEAWLQHVRNSSYIDNRLEKSQRQAKD